MVHVIYSGVSGECSHTIAESFLLSKLLYPSYIGPIVSCSCINRSTKVLVFMLRLADIATNTIQTYI